MMHQRADDGHQHAKLSQVHPALGGFRMTQSLEAQDEKD